MTTITFSVNTEQTTETSSARSLMLDRLSRIAGTTHEALLDGTTLTEIQEHWQRDQPRDL